MTTTRAVVVPTARAVPLLAATHAVPRVGGVKVAVAVTRKLHRRALGGRADAGGVELVHCREVPCPPGASVTLLLVVQQRTRTTGDSCTPHHPPVSLWWAPDANRLIHKPLGTPAHEPVHHGRSDPVGHLALTRRADAQGVRGPLDALTRQHSLTQSVHFCTQPNPHGRM
jgi:hypothetical protein